MTYSDLIKKIKKITITALMSDENLMSVLVLKGGNAIDIAYDMNWRGSMDIDFSMEGDFTDIEKKKIEQKINYLLKTEFHKENLIVFDVHLIDKPTKINEEIKSFWGGYLVEFKIISKELADQYQDNIDAMRRNAISIHDDNSTKFTIDISKYEYIGDKKIKEIEGTVLYVYSPEMIAIEKLRALCQQVPRYKQIVSSMTSKSRARDFYDFYNLTESFNIDYTKKENIELCSHIFEAKHVTPDFIKDIKEQKEFHRGSWESVVATVNQNEQLKEFDFYFDYLQEKSKQLLESFRIE